MDDYVLLDQIGEGSFGRVFRARRKFTGSMVAIKLIPKIGQAREDIQSLRTEITILQRVDHPNIMRLIDIFETNTDICVVTELGRGDLFNIIHDGQTLPEEVIRTISAQLLSALKYLHGMRIIHRDLKPQNVLVSTNGTVKLCDFGFARAMSRNTIMLTSIKGTPLYMAPELVQEKEYNDAIDVWSLGIILFELYSGKPPFYADSIYILIQRIINDPIEWPSNMSHEFKDFLQQILQKDPSFRPDCTTLLKHPFVADINLGVFIDVFGSFKTRQFEMCLDETMTTDTQQNTPGNNYQAILLNPISKDGKDLADALKHLFNNQEPEYLSSFALHFQDFIVYNESREIAMQIAMKLLESDSEHYRPYFVNGSKLLFVTELYPITILFLTKLFVEPFGFAIAEGDPQTDFIDELTTEKAKGFRDSLMSFVFNTDVSVFELIAFMCHFSPCFLETFADSQAVQYILIFASNFIRSTNQTIRTSCACIILQILQRSPSFKSTVCPIPGFIDKVTEILNREIESVEDFCEFTLALELGSSFLDTKNGTVELSSVINYATIMPQRGDFLAYAAIRSSPFDFIDLDGNEIATAVDKIPVLLPYHQTSLLNKVLQGPLEHQNISGLLSLLSTQTCVDKVCEYFTLQIGMHVDLPNSLIDNGCVVIICRELIDENITSPQAYVLLLALAAKTKLSAEITDNIIKTITSINQFHEISLLILISLARVNRNISHPSVMKYSTDCLKSHLDSVRSRALQLIGHIQPTEEFIISILPKVFEELQSQNEQNRQFAAYALGTFIEKGHDIEDLVVENIGPVIKLIGDSSSKTIEFGCCILASLIRKSGRFVGLLQSLKVAESISGALVQVGQTAGALLRPLSVFCMYTEFRKSLKKNAVLSIVQSLTDSADSGVVADAAMILRALED